MTKLPVNKIFASFALVGMLAVVFTANTFLRKVEAQTGITISPSFLDIAITAGESRDLSLNIFNSLSTPISFALSPITFDGNGNPNNELNGEEEWLELPVEEQTLQPSTGVTAQYKLHIPADAELGAHWLGVRVQITGTGAASGSGASIDAQVVQNLNLNITSDSTPPQEAFQITSFTGPAFLLAGPADYSVAIKNVSDYYTRPVVYLQAVDPRGNIIWTTVVNDGKALLRPGAELAEIVTLKNNDLSWPGVYKVEVLVFGSLSGANMDRRQEVIYLPWWLLIGIAFALFIFSRGYARLYSKRKKSFGY